MVNVFSLAICISPLCYGIRYLVLLYHIHFLNVLHSNFSRLFSHGSSQKPTGALLLIFSSIFKNGFLCTWVTNILNQLLKRAKINLQTKGIVIFQYNVFRFGSYATLQPKMAGTLYSRPNQQMLYRYSTIFDVLDLSFILASQKFALNNFKISHLLNFAFVCNKNDLKRFFIKDNYKD